MTRRGIPAIVAGVALLGAGLVPWTLMTPSGRTPVVDRVGAQSPTALTQSYALLQTWDGEEGQGAPGSMLFPAGIEVTDEAVFLVDRGNDRIERFTYDLAFVAAWGQRGSGAGDYSDPRDISADGSVLYVTDTGNGRVVATDKSGAVLSQFTVAGMSHPWGVAASAGRVAVTDPVARRAVVVKDGSVVAELAGVVEPLGADTGPDGRIYIADRAASKVLIFATDGTPGGSLVTRVPPIDVAVDVLGDLYVESAGGVFWYPAGSVASRQAMYYDGTQGVAVDRRAGVYATVARDDFHGVVRWPWQPSDSTFSPHDLRSFPPGRMSEPHALYAAADGLIWVADAWPRLQAFRSDGTPAAQVVPQGAGEVVPVDLVAPPSGGLLVGEARRLVRVTESGAVTQQVRLASGATNYWLTALEWLPDLPGVTVLDSALLYARQYGVTLTLQPVGSWPLGAVPWQLFWDLATEPASVGGRTYVVNRSAHELWIYENGRRSGTWPVDGTPSRVDVDAEGNVFLLTIEGFVHKLTRGGNEVALWDAGSFSAGASEVADLAVDSGGRVYTADRAANVVRVWGRDQATPEPPMSRPGACRLRSDKTAQPAAVRLDEQVTVQLQIGGQCPSALPHADIVLAIDTSGSMNAHGEITDTRAAAIAFVNSVDVTRDRVAVVAFSSEAALAQALTSDRALAVRAIAGLRAVGGTNIAQAFQVSAGELFGPRARPDTQPVIVLLTDGRDEKPDGALDASAAAQAQGARVFTIGFGDVDPMVMVLSASTPEDYYLAPDTSRLSAIYAEIAQRITASVLARSMTLEDEIPANMRYVDGSAQPPATYDAGRRMLQWQLTDIPLAGLTLSYRVTPTQLGRHPTNVQAQADYVDGLGSSGHLRFPVPEVEVLSLAPTATSTSTPFPTPSPPPTRTPLPPEPLFLPIAVKQRCADKEIHADVVLVMDTSSSMEGPSVPGGPSKLEVAKAAALTFVSLLHMPGDQAAIVRFDQDAELVQPLTGDVAALDRALQSLAPGQGTRIDLGIERAAEELASSRHEANSNRVIVLLTDGRNTGVEDAVVLQRATEAKDAGVFLYTIGLGEDVDGQMLQDIATTASFAFLAPTAEELEDIYRQIAYTIFCPGLTWP